MPSILQMVGADVQWNYEDQKQREMLCTRVRILVI